MFIPNPLRYFKCHRFGLGSSTCRRSARNQQCGEAPHNGSECIVPKVCLSCGSSNHLVSSLQRPPHCGRRRRLPPSLPPQARVMLAHAQAAKVQTESNSTQTDLLACLPPLKRLKPLTAKLPTTSNAATESILTDTGMLSPSPDPSLPTQDSPVVAQRPGPDAQSSSRPYSKGSKSGRLRRDTKPPEKKKQSYPISVHTSRPPVRVSMGRNRS